MKKNYALFFAIPVVLLTLLYFSTWWFFGGIGAMMLFIAYRYYALQVESLQDRNEVLEKDIEHLHMRLELSVVKEQKTSKEAEQIRQSRKDLLSVLSHEIRTPMNGVMGMTLLLNDSVLNKEQQECISTIRHCGESLLTTVNTILVNDILDFSKLHQDKTQLEYKDFDLRDCLEEVITMFAVKAGKAGIDLVYEIDENVPALLIGDQKRLRQVFINLVENAMKFTTQGEIFIKISTALSIAGQPPELSFKVQDTGSGIPSDQLKHLFIGIPVKEELAETDKESNGLGLMICKKLIELMGGQIEVKSSPEQGTVFSFKLPVTPSMKSIREHANHHNMIHLEGKHILVIDDNETTRQILLRQLHAWKMLPVTAASGNEAIKILSESPGIHLVLADMHLPVLNGLTIDKIIMERHLSIPIIGMDYPGDADQVQPLRLFSALLNKPLRRHLLRDQLIGLLAPQVAVKRDETGNPLSEEFSKLYPLRILVAEDNLINQKIATRVLNKLGYQPDIANHGKEVMEKVSSEHYDIILMDVQMPQMNGLEATRMIRTCLEIQPIVIAVTANVMQGDRDECVQAGMDDYMSKPINLDELVNQLQKWAMVIREKRRA
jgi:signal transduction histidine kinase/CheY-like chemotaxis protein